MKFLLDQDVYSITGRFLKGLGHDVVLAAQVGLAEAEDGELLKTDSTRAKSDIRDAGQRFRKPCFCERVEMRGSLSSHTAINTECRAPRA